MSADGQVFTCRVDEKDIITFVNEAWKRFADTNDGGSLSSLVVGNSIWKFVHGEDVVHVFRKLFEKVRRHQERVSFPFRCDSPSMRRLLRMEILPVADSGLEFRSRIEKAEPQPQVLRILDPHVPRNSHSFVRMCAWCKKIADGENWFEPHEALDRMRLFDAPAMPQITHGMCEECFDRMKSSATGPALRSSAGSVSVAAAKWATFAVRGGPGRHELNAVASRRG